MSYLFIQNIHGALISSLNRQIISELLIVCGGDNDGPAVPFFLSKDKVTDLNFHKIPH